MTALGQANHGASADMDAFLEHGLDGEVEQAVRVALRVLDNGTPAHSVVADLLAPAQLEVGERWSRNQLSVADEHLVTVSAESALHALAATLPPQETTAEVVLACPEGEWHATAAHMFSVQLQSQGVGVQFIGASASPVDLARLLERQRPDALVVTCTMPICFVGVTRLVDVAHGLGLPVLVGGHAFLDGSDKVRRLGGDAWAPDLGAAVAVLEEWRRHPPPVAQSPMRSAAAAFQLDVQAEELSARIFEALVDRRRALPEHEQGRPALDREEVALVVRHLAAAKMVESDEVFTDFLDWLGGTGAARGRPRTALRAELEACVPFLRSFPRSFSDLLQLGADRLRSP